MSKIGNLFYIVDEHALFLETEIKHLNEDRHCYEDLLKIEGLYTVVKIVTSGLLKEIYKDLLKIELKYYLKHEK